MKAAVKDCKIFKMNSKDTGVTRYFRDQKHLVTNLITTEVKNTSVLY